MESRETKRVVSPSALVLAKGDKGRYERWVHRMAAPVVLVERTTTSFTGKGDKVLSGGVAVCFQNHIVYLDKKDSDYDLCRKALMETRAYKVGRLVCYDAMNDKQKRMLDPEFLGVNRKTNLKRYGIDNERHLQAVLDFAGDTSGDENKKLREENAALKARLAGGKTVKGKGKGPVERDPDLPATPPADKDED